MSGTYSAGILPGTTQQADPGAPGVAGSSGVMLGLGTGAQGTQSVGDGGGMSSNPFVAVWSWINRPITTPMAPTDVFLLVGVVLIAIVAWNLILYHVRIAAEAV
jgi:hypothetical protein